MATTLSTVAPILLPPTITGPIFLKTAESSAVMSLARKVPLAVNAQTAIPVPMDMPTADWVSEGGIKPTGGGGVGVKIMTGKKLALLLPISQEIAMSNSAGLYDQLEQDLPTAMSRAFDYAAVHGLSLRTGAAGPFPDYLADTPNQQTIGATAAVNGGVYTDLVLGMQKVVNASSSGYEFSGFAADPRLKPELMLSVDTIGRPLMVDAYSNANSGPGGLTSSLIGFPAAYNNGISGKYYRQGDTVQTVTITATGGTFTLSVGGLTTAPIAYNATAATVQTAIQALAATTTTFGGSVASTAVVSGSAGGPYTVTFLAGGASGPIIANGALLTGPSNSAVVAQNPVLDSGLRAIGGDWSQCAWGEGMSISVAMSTEASYIDAQGVTHSAFQENLVLLRVEAYYGFVRNDKQAFVAYTHAAGS